MQEARSSAHSWQKSVAESQSWSELESQHKESSSSTSFNWDQELINRVAKMPSPGSDSGKMGTIQAAHVLNNPRYAKDYAEKAIHEMIQEKIQLKNQELMHSEKIQLENKYSISKDRMKRDFEEKPSDFKDRYNLNNLV